MPRDCQNVTFYVKSNTISDRNLYVKFTFIMERDKSIASVKTATLKIPVIKPFEVSTKFLSVLFDDLTKFYVGERFVLLNTLTCLSPQPIIIESTSFEFVSSNFVLYLISNI